jgi:hypothetical protein
LLANYGGLRPAHSIFGASGGSKAELARLGFKVSARTVALRPTSSRKRSRPQLAAIKLVSADAKVISRRMLRVGMWPAVCVSASWVTPVRTEVAK